MTAHSLHLNATLDLHDEEMKTALFGLFSSFFFDHVDQGLSTFFSPTTSSLLVNVKSYEFDTRIRKNKFAQSTFIFYFILFSEATDHANDSSH